MSVTKDAVRRLGRLQRSIGSGVECPICGWTGREFEPGGPTRRRNRMCPACGSLERHRMLVLYLRERTAFVGGGWRVLDVAAKKTFRDLTVGEGRGQHIGVNLVVNSMTDVATDLTNAGIAAASFDLVVCFHVLEHIPDDLAAMAELHRVLRPGGIAVIQVPLREDRPTEEDPGASPEERIRRFGKDDHVRYYGLDIVDRLESVGLEVELDRPRDWLPPERYDRYALAGDDQVLLIASR